ncbi:MAG: DUF1566 domain-containing protein [Deltaproteobacteria bacterium]|nr:DUF1566 domain-containing protein [Deltaproteobacteria bacterium]
MKILLAYYSKKFLFLFLIFLFIYSPNLQAQGGDLQITCEPGLRIYLDGKFVGKSNFKDDGKYLSNLEPGTHTIRVEKLGFLSKEYEINIADGKISEIKVGILDAEEGGRKSQSQKNEKVESGIPIIELRSEYRDVSTDEWSSYFKTKFFVNGKETIKNDYEKKIINGSPVIIDHATSLMWHSGSPKTVRGGRAMPWIIENLNYKNYAGYSDWRLPTHEELASLIEETRMNGKLFISEIFPKKQRVIYTGDFWRDGYYVVCLQTMKRALSSYNPRSESYVRAVRSLK